MNRYMGTLLASAAATALLLPSMASAQDAALLQQPTNAAAGAAGSLDTTGGEVVVTGTRIARTDLTSTTPISVVSSEHIEQTGAGNIQDALNELPALGSPTLSRSNSNFQSAANGTATLNLRNLGQSRTLVLFNGRRSVGILGGSAVDVNNVPTDFIDHVEVTTGGASAVYGSDAIAGVVNFVLKDKFDGLRIRAQSTISDKGDAPRQLASITGGRSFADDRGHVILNFTYDNDEGLKSRERSFSAHDQTRSSYAAQGLFSVDGAYAKNGKTFTFDADNNLKTYQGANVDGFDRNQTRYLSVPVKRLMGAGLANFEIADSVKIYGEGEYTHTTSRSSLEPTAIDDTNLLNFDGTAFAGIPITNPYIPTQIKNAMLAAGVTTLNFRRRSNDIFSRSNQDHRTYWRAVGGVKGDINPSWKFDVSYEHSVSKERTSSENAYAGSYGAALNAVRDSSGNIVCADAAARAAGCVPINIFGFNTAAPEASKFITTYSGPSDTARGLVHGETLIYRYDADMRQDDVSGSLTGTLFKLPGGAVSVALGAEYRAEKSAERFDPYTVAGVTLGNALGDAVGKYHVTEEFAEIVAPLLADRPLIQYLGLEAAFRHGDYSTVGGVNSFKAGGEYAPSRSIRFRGMYTQATRAPNIGDLYAAQSQTFYGGVDDPCDQGQGQGDNASSFSALPEKCKSIPGIANTISKNGHFAYSTAQLQGVDGLLGGNPDLRQETAHSITAGVVLTPTFLRGFSLTADYYHIRVKNAVSSLDPAVSVGQCLATGNPTFCSNVIRDANGFVTRVNSINLNIGNLLVAGVDVQGRYAFSLGANNFEVSVYWNHLIKQQTVPYPGGDVVDELGRSDAYSSSRLGSGFHNRVFSTATYRRGGFSFNYRMDYYGPIKTSLDSPTAQRLGSVFYHNVQARYDLGESKRFAIYGGVNNLTDRKPPIVNDSAGVAWPGTNTIASTYDLYGRMLYVGAEVKF